MTQEEVAEAIGVTRTWYGKIEAADARLSLRLLSRIVKALMLHPWERRYLFDLAVAESEE